MGMCRYDYGRLDLRYMYAWVDGSDINRDKRLNRVGIEDSIEVGFFEHTQTGR
jgi:hypothetical protein